MKMCKLKSAIVLKDRVYCPGHDSHTQVLEELKIKDSRKNAETIFVRVELSPPNGNPFSDIDTWILDVDQDIWPNWFFEEVEKSRVVQAVKDWKQDNIFVGIDDLKNIVSGNETRSIYLKNCKNAQIESLNTSPANVKSYGTSTANSLYRSSCSKFTFRVSDNSTFKDHKNKKIYQSGNWEVALVEQKDESGV